MKRFFMAPAEWLSETWGLEQGELGDALVAWDLLGSFIAFVFAMLVHFLK